MFRLIKWTVIGAAVFGAAGFFVFGDHLGSYCSTVTNSLQEGIRGRIPIQFEIRRAEKLIQEIEPEIQECKRDVARAEVDLEDLITDVTRLEERVVKQQKKLESGCILLDSKAQASYHLAGHEFSRRRVEIDLERTFSAFKNNKALLKGKKALIERQTRAVSASRAKLDAVRTEKAKLEHSIATLKAQKRHVDALAASSKRFDLDETSLSKAKEVLSRVKKRLDVAQRMIEDDIFFSDSVAVNGNTEPRRDIVKEIGMHLQEQGREVESKALAPRKGVPMLGAK